MSNFPVGFLAESAQINGFNATDIEQLARTNGFAFSIVDILSDGVDEVNGHFRLDEVNIATAEDAAFAYGIVSTTVFFGTSRDDESRVTAETLLSAQIHWSKHIGLRSVIVDIPARALNEFEAAATANLARSLAEILTKVMYTQVMIRVPLNNAGWKFWNFIRSSCAHVSSLSVALEYPEGHSDLDVNAVNVWFSEPVKLVIIPSEAFIPNKKGYPVLSKKHQHWSRRLMDLNGIQFAVAAPPSSETVPSGDSILASYQMYVQNLHSTRPEPSLVDQFAQGYDDYLQAPLQPLMDNLDSATYEVFEKDPVKYSLYEEAITAALSDRVKAGNGTKYVIMVFGAGRGPLVDCSLRAAQKADCTIKVFALEKNPNAMIILQRKMRNDWSEADVSLVHSDMRLWNPPVKADILVSELLGSFGDNELSPECLDGAQKVLKEDGISIPESYTAFVTPISTTKLFNELSSSKDLAAFETPYVVKLKAIKPVGEPVPLWTFAHPCRVSEGSLPGTLNFNKHNTRYAVKSFAVKEDTLVHGLAGYFESILYRHVQVSINPSTHSPDMSSWFPIYFPLQTPLLIAKGSAVEVHFWRLTTDRKVWYEWACSSKKQENSNEYVSIGSIHNVGGRSSWIGL